MGQNLTGMGRGEKHVLFRVGVYSRSFWAGKEFGGTCYPALGKEIVVKTPPIYAVNTDRDQRPTRE